MIAQSLKKCIFRLILQIPFVAIRDKSLMDLLDLSDRSIVMFKDNNWLAAMPDSATSTKGYSSSTSLMSFSTEVYILLSFFCAHG